MWTTGPKYVRVRLVMECFRVDLIMKHADYSKYLYYIWYVCSFVYLICETEACVYIVIDLKTDDMFWA